MSVNKHFSMMPNINHPRTRMIMEQSVKGSFDFGKLIPLDALPVIPGDTHNVEVYGLIRMSTPIAPIMDDIEANLYLFYVPSRLLYDKYESWFTSNTDTGGEQGGSKIDFAANASLPAYSLYLNGVTKNSINRYFGKPVVSQDSSKTSLAVVNALKERAYFKIWTDWFIPRQFISYTRNVSSTDAHILGTINTGGGNVNILAAAEPMRVCKNFDYFTASTLTPQYSTAPVTLPLSGTAPVGILDSSGVFHNEYVAFKKIGDSNEFGSSYDYSGGTSTNAYDLMQSPSNPIIGVINPNAPSGLRVADLAQVTAASVNDLRYAFALQKFAERSSFGNRFFESLEAHYAVSSPDARLQRAEYLGHKKFLINVAQVESTAGYETGSTTKVGQPGAVSVTGFKFNLGTKGFVEPGYLVCLISTRQLNHTYGQGIMKEDSKLTRFEFYTPEFANLGDQSTLNKEIYLSGDATVDEQTFGYQEAWAEDRYRAARVCGLLDPNVENSLDYWTLADKFASKPSLSANFLLETRDNLARCLTTGTSGPDFIYDVRIKYKADRELPAYTIPGLIDHFGTH